MLKNKILKISFGLGLICHLTGCNISVNDDGVEVSGPQGKVSVNDVGTSLESKAGKINVTKKGLNLSTEKSSELGKPKIDSLKEESKEKRIETPEVSITAPKIKVKKTPKIKVNTPEVINTNIKNISVVGDGEKPKAPKIKIKKQVEEKPTIGSNADLGSTCEQAYQTVVDEVGQDFSKCYGFVDDSESCNEKAKKTNLVLIMDSSGSMARRIGGITRMDVAKKASTAFLSKLTTDLNFGLVLYGHKGGNSTSQKAMSCAGIETAYPLSPVNATTINTHIQKLSPTGWTPIADSLNHAQSLLVAYPQEKNKNIIVLVSDGEETCDGQPIKTAQKIASTYGTSIHVIGFDVLGETEAQLKNIAQAGNGTFFSARTLNELTQALENLTKVSCAGVKDAWEDGMSSTLEAYLECGSRLDNEKLEVSMSATFDAADGRCMTEIEGLYEERYESIKKQIEESYNAGQKKLNNINPVSDEAYFNSKTTDNFEAGEADNDGDDWDEDEIDDEDDESDVWDDDGDDW